MARNTVRDEQKANRKLSTGMMSLGNLERKHHRDEEDEHSISKQYTSNPFLLITKYFDLEKIVGIGVPVRYLPHSLFLTFLGVLHIANVHYSDRIGRKQAKMQAEVEELRANYTTFKASYMYQSKKVEVAKKVAKIQLVQGKRPPYKIVIEKSEY